jgi:[ribosomal protein S5]-alanine N-acetyltransferase
MIRPGSLSTERDGVTLRRLSAEDACPYFDAVDNNREHLSQFGDRTSAKYPTISSVRESIKNQDPTKWRLGIWDEDIFVGTINLTPHGETAEIGYWVDSRHTRRGYATLAVRALSEFSRDKFLDIMAESVVGNDASVGVLTQSGFEVVSSSSVQGLTFQQLRLTDSLQ